jgi:hypothetical protein
VVKSEQSKADCYADPPRESRFLLERDDIMKIDGLQTFALGIFVLSLVVIAASSFHFGGRIVTPKIPMQWGIDGNPTWYAARTIGLWWMAYFTLSVGIGLIVLGFYSESAKAGTIWYAVIAFSMITAATQIWHLNAVSKWAASQ